MKYRVSIDGEWLDDILFRLYGHVDGTLQIAFELNRKLILNNRHTSLAEIGHRLPRGLEINLPDPPVKKKNRFVTLFD